MNFNEDEQQRNSLYDQNPSYIFYILSYSSVYYVHTINTFFIYILP